MRGRRLRAKKEVYWISSFPMSERIRQAILSVHKGKEVIFNEITSHRRNPDGRFRFTEELKFNSDDSFSTVVRQVLRDIPDAVVYTAAGPVYCMAAREEALPFAVVYQENGEVMISQSS